MCVLRYAAVYAKQDKEIPSASSVIYLAVDNIAESYKQLKEQGVKFVAEPMDQGWGGRTAVMLDPDNNILVLAQVQV
jgi:predicted enzyme related to lactoylglutathione lyase